jgi:hypothetical protein
MLLNEAERHRFDETVAVGILAAQIGIAQSQVEPAYVNIIPGVRRQGDTIRQVLQAAFSPAYHAQRRMSNGLEFGFRIILDNDRELQRSVEKLQEAVSRDQLSPSFQEKGFGSVAGFDALQVVSVDESGMVSSSGTSSSSSSTSDKSQTSKSAGTSSMMFIVVGLGIAAFVMCTAAIG